MINKVDVTKNNAIHILLIMWNLGYSIQDVTLVHLRLLALCEFGPDSALAPADEVGEEWGRKERLQVTVRSVESKMVQRANDRIIYSLESRWFQNAQLANAEIRLGPRSSVICLHMLND